MQKYVVKGNYNEKGKLKTFTKEVEAQNERFARELIFNFFGSKQGVTRRNLRIKEAKQA